MAFHFQTRGRRGEAGYVLLTLLLAVALIIIFAAAIVPTIKFEIERDREEELIHRGVQYSRAIRAYYKKFGRYPTKLEDLESANNMRFLRKRYKDPITGQDFKLLHFGEVKLTFSGGGLIPGVNAIGNPAGNGGGAFGQTPAFGGNGGLGQSSGFGGNGGFGANSNSTPGQNPQNTATPAEGGDGTQNSPSSSSGSSPQGAGGQTDSANAGGDPFTSRVFGGGPVVGVVSNSKKATIREFNHKKKYNEWQFIYDPGTDRGGLLMTPNQPSLQGFGQQGNQNLNGQNNNGNGFGSGNSFGGPPSGMNNSNSPSGGFGQPSQPSNPPPQQQ